MNGDPGNRYNSRLHAAVAQLVERNLAKVEVESSRLFCRSRFPSGGRSILPPGCFRLPTAALAGGAPRAG